MAFTKAQRHHHYKPNYRLTIGILLILVPHTFSASGTDTSTTLGNHTTTPSELHSEQPATSAATALQSNNHTNSLVLSNGTTPTLAPVLNVTTNHSVTNKLVLTIPTTPSIIQSLPVTDTTTTTTTNGSSIAPLPESTSTTRVPLLNVVRPSRFPAITRPPPDATCFGHARLEAKLQPVHSDYAKMKKCCPHGQNYRGKGECVPENVLFDASFVEAVFYDSCIEDDENVAIKLAADYGNPCAGLEAFLYNADYGDLLYVLQNGSLLRVDDDFGSYDVFDAYCLDMDRDTQLLTAIVCNQTMGHIFHVSKAQSYLYAICMLMSVPCLLVTAGLYLAIPQLRNLHGKSLACHSLCLATGFLLLSIAQIRGTVTQGIGYVIQYFILACFFWLGVMCLDICSHVWYFIPRRKEISRRAILLRFIFYAFISFGVPLVLVMLTVSKQLPGMPSYYLKGLTEATRSSQQYFIPPISSMLFICFLLLITSYFGFRKLNPVIAKTYLMKKNIARHNISLNIELMDVKLYAEVMQIARSTAYLYIIMTVNWVFEIISFYIHSSEASVVLFDILNALQGIVIFIIFVSLPQPLNIIKRWWMDRGSFAVPRDSELQTLRNSEVKEAKQTNEKNDHLVGVPDV